MARTSDRRMRSEVGMSREARIAALVSVGLKNDAIWAAMESEYPQIIEEAKRRREIAGSAIPFNKEERDKVGRAIRSVRGLMMKEDEAMQEVINAAGGQGEIKPVDQYELRNISRFQTGMPAMDNIYGKTTFLHLDGEKKGEPTGVIQHGMPEGFLSIWAGSPGVGKSRLAIALNKTIHGVEREMNKAAGMELRPTLYYNGEAEESQFRQWVGKDADPELFLASTSEMIQLERIVVDVYKYRPRLVIIDSWQMIAEVRKGQRGMLSAMSRFKLLKADETAGRPHFLFISQLNKQEELMGSRLLEHLVDFVARVTRYEGRKGTFLFEVPRKNRGGETPKGALFRHTENSVECISTDLREHASMLKLIQPSQAVMAPVQPAQPTPPQS